MKRASTDLTTIFRIACIPEPITEYRFDSVRRWRFDYAWPDKMIAIEYEGFGRHQRWNGYSADCDKYNVAALQGWSVIRFTAWHIKSQILPETIDLLKKLFEVKK